MFIYSPSTYLMLIHPFLQSSFCTKVPGGEQGDFYILPTSPVPAPGLRLFILIEHIILWESGKVNR